MQRTTEETNKAGLYESLTDTEIKTKQDKSYTELNSDVWNEIFPLRKPLATQNAQPNPVAGREPKESLNTSTAITNFSREKTPVHQSNKKVVEVDTSYANFQEIGKESVTDSVTGNSLTVNLNKKKGIATYVSVENESPHDYDYIQHDGINLQPLKINVEKSGKVVTSDRPLPVVCEDTYEPLRTTAKTSSNKTRLLRKKCLLIGGSLLVFVVLASALIIGIVLGLSNEANGNLLVLDDSVQGDGRISGIAVLDSQMFVVRYKLSPEVYVYNTHDFTFDRNITINNSSELRAIVANPRDNCLYISDPGLNVVHRHNLTNNVTTQWPVGGRCYGLSLTSAGNLLAALRNTNKIQEYTLKGILVREIFLAVSIDNPWQSVQLSSSDFVISSGNGGSMHQVCVVNSNGSSIWCYGSLQGSGLGQLNKPGQLAVDMEENVFAADTGNNRVVLLSSSLTYLRYITIHGYELSNPWSLYLDQANRRLYIGEWTSTGRLFALDV